MPGPYEIRVRRIEEHVVPGKRLGRHAYHDSRSLAYPFRAPAQVPVVSVEHKRNAPILDQGDLGSCTGNAMTGALATTPAFDGLPASHPALNEAEAVKLYEAATRLDTYPGSYPPDDTGSDGGSVCKAAQKAGLISGYTHAASVGDVLQALMSGPVLFGIDWYEGFDTPSADGLVKISGSVRGGHEIVARRVDADRKLIGMDNSWGTSYGAGGSFWFSYATLEALLSGSDGDATVPVPLSAPAPVPVPPQPPEPPVPGDPDQVFAAVLKADDRPGKPWYLEHHVGANGRAARAAGTWLASKGL